MSVRNAYRVTIILGGGLRAVLDDGTNERALRHLRVTPRGWQVRKYTKSLESYCPGVFTLCIAVD